MLKFFKKMFGLLSVEEALHETKKVRCHGARFTIKKINTLDYLNGSKVMLQIFDTYKVGKKQEMDPSHMKKIKEHYRDIIMSGVVKPELVRKPEQGRLCVDFILDNWEVATNLYEQIIAFTYGKKKLLTSQSKNF